MKWASEKDLRDAAESGDLDAMNRLASALYQREEHAEAESWLERAAQLGDVTALTNLGALLSDHDPERAEECLRPGRRRGK